MRTVVAVVLLSLASACMIVPPDDEPDAAISKTPPRVAFDAGVDGGGTGVGGGDGGGGGGIIPPDEGHGVGQLWLVRIDHGSANTAASVEALVAASTKAIADAKVDLVGSAVASLYEPSRVIWAHSPNAPTPITIADAIAMQAVPDGPAPSSCPTTMLFRLGSELRMLFTGAFLAFPTPPAALFIGIVDHGARPVPLADCGDPASGLAADPADWLSTGAVVPPRLRVRIAWIATPENGTTASLRARCAATPGIPPSVIDVVDPSTMLFYDPLLSSLTSRAPGLAAPLDLCDAFAAPALVSSAVSVWLSGLRLP
jgi:hypothetical protein